MRSTNPARISRKQPIEALVSGGCLRIFTAGRIAAMLQANSTVTYL